MDEKLLCQIGLSQQQARTYRALVLKKGSRPSQIAKLIGESRSNTYALLDKLVEIGIAYREDVNKKLTYFPESPKKLEVLINEKISQEQVKLEKIKRKMPEMLSAFNADRDKPQVAIHSGKKEILRAHTKHAEQGKELYMLHGRKDIVFLGAEQVKKMRWNYTNKSVDRHSLSPFSPLINLYTSRKARLQRILLPQDSYDSPVEWSVNGDQVLIAVYESDGYTVTIDNPTIANSLRLFLSVVSNTIKATPEHQKLYDQLLKKHPEYSQEKSESESKTHLKNQS